MEEMDRVQGRWAEEEEHDRGGEKQGVLADQFSFFLLLLFLVFSDRVSELRLT